MVPTLHDHKANENSRRRKWRLDWYHFVKTLRKFNRWPYLNYWNCRRRRRRWRCVYPSAVVATTDGGIRREEPLDHQQLDTLVVVFDGALPVLGCLPSAFRLELVRSHPCIIEQNTCALAPLAKLIQMQHSLVQTTFYTYDGVSTAWTVPSFFPVCVIIWFALSVLQCRFRGRYVGYRNRP